ncbi:MAG: hypothetical protein ACLFQ5_12850 [Oceanicaulis sp.]
MNARPIRMPVIAGLAGLAVTACATTEPGPIACRDATADERALFGSIIAHDEARVADLMAEGPAAARLRALDPAIEAQVFGARMGDRSVRTVLMQPPLCLWDEQVSETERLTYVFPAGRFESLQNETIPGAELGEAAVDHARCVFIRQDGRWVLEDACIATFAPESLPG